MFPLEDVPARTYVFAYGVEGASYAVEVESEEKCPTFLPAAFSVKLGLGSSQSAPCFYSVLDELPQLQYRGTAIRHCTCKTSYATAASCAQCTSDQLKYAGKLPVSGISSASSAAGGWVHCLPP